MAIEHDYEEKKLDDLVQEVYETRFDIHKEHAVKPNFLLSIREQESGKLKGIAMEGSLVLVSGAEKTRKSTLMSMAKACVLNENGIYENWESTIKSGCVLWFDTEMNYWEFDNMQRNTFRMSGLDNINPNINDYAFNLRRYAPEDRLLIANQIIKEFGETGLLRMVIIDGVADLVNSVNDMSEANSLITTFCWWADSFKIPIISAIHTNKSNDSATGSLGYSFAKKCSYHLQTSQETPNSPTKVIAKSCRGGESFKSFEFCHDPETSLPTIVRDYSMLGLDTRADIILPPNEFDDNPF